MSVYICLSLWAGGFEQGSGERAAEGATDAGRSRIRASLFQLFNVLMLAVSAAVILLIKRGSS